MEEPPGHIIKLKEYENKRINSDTNFGREDIIDTRRWGGLIKSHIEKFIDAGIIIQYTLSDQNIYGFGDWVTSLEFLLPYKKHIIIETENEILNDFIYVERALEIEEAALSMGFIASGGAWGRSHHGQENAKKYLKRSKAKIANMHRPYDTEQQYLDWIKFLKDSGFISIENEFLIDDSEKVDRFARLIIERGGHFNVYAGNHLKLMGRLKKEFN